MLSSDILHLIKPGDIVYYMEDAAATPCKTIYIVKSGDSMYSIAQMFNVSLNDLMSANPQIINPSLIYPGQQICIPVSHVPYPCRCHTIYTVRPGDSMYSISQMFGVPLDRLISCNPHITNPSLIYPGQQICIPVSHVPYPCRCHTIYTVRPGDSMYSISQMFCVPLDRLISCNPHITNPSIVIPGQQVCIPASTPSPSPFPCQCKTIYTAVSGDTLFSIAQAYNVPLDRLISCNPQITNPSVIYPGQQVCIPIWRQMPDDPSSLPELKKGDTGPFNIYLNNTLKNKGYDIEDNNINFDDKTEEAVKAIQKNAGYEETGVVDKKTWDLILTDSTLEKLEEDDPKYSMFNYVVKSGDTLFSIALMFGTTVNAILLANPQITNPSLIYPGMVLRIPVPSPRPMPPRRGMQYVVKPGDTMYKIAQAYGISLDELIRANPQIKNPSVLTPGQIIIIPVSGSAMENSEK